jgi:hypothetical protein
MSHSATNWAIKQRGFRPATKFVLWHLCDRYHPDHGCFPDQETLADDCEMSRSALNEHLQILEDAGLIARERRIDSRSKKRISTRYHFAFEEGFPRPDSGHGAMSGNDVEPCPEMAESHVRNPDSNPVKNKPVNNKPPLPPCQQGGIEISKIEKAPGPDFETCLAGWPSPETQDLNQARKKWADLGAVDRRKAVETMPQWLEVWRRDRGKRRVYPLWKYLMNRPWKLVHAPVQDGPKAVKLYGPEWMLWRFELVLRGPGTLDNRHHDFWRGVRDWDQVSKATGFGRPAPDWRPPPVEMLPLVIDSEAYTAWRAAFEALQWPWIPDPVSARVVYFPVGVPPDEGTLEEFVGMFQQREVVDA